MRLFAFVAVAAGLSLALRPPPSLDKDLIDALPFEADWGTNTRVIELPCPECRVGPSKPLKELLLDHVARPGETFPESVLRLNVSVAQNGLIDKLMLNDCSFYPAPSLCTTVWTDQFVKSPCVTWEYKASPETAFRITRYHLDDDLLGRGIKLNVLHLWIRRVATKLIGPEPEIDVKMLIWPNGQILIATDPARAPTKVPPSDSDCPHHGHRPGHHHHHHHHHWCSRFIRLLRAFVLHALIPIIVGLVVAAVAFYIWRKRFLRRQRSTYSRVPQEVASKDDFRDKNQGFVNRSDAPLLGEDAPLMTK